MRGELGDSVRKREVCRVGSEEQRRGMELGEGGTAGDWERRWGDGQNGDCGWEGGREEGDGGEGRGGRERGREGEGGNRCIMLQ